MEDMTRTLVIAVVSILLLSTVAIAGNPIELDEHTPLTDEETISEYEQTEKTTVELDRYSLSITIAENSDEFDTISTFDAAVVWVHLEYNESIPRTFRIYIPDEYFSPIPQAGLQSENGNATADLLPVENRNYTSFAVKFDEPTTATFAVSRTGGLFLDMKSKGRSVLEQEYNVSIPSISGTGEQWSFVEPSELEGTDVSYKIPVNGTATVQYKTSGTWDTVPNCQTGASVCQFERNNSTYVVSMKEEAPLIRYKPGQDRSSGIAAAFRDLAQVPDRIGEMMNNLLDDLL